MEFYDHGAYDRISKSIAESRRGTSMPSRRRGKIKKKVVASCLVTILGMCCCNYCSVGPAVGDGPQQDFELLDDDTAMAKESFVNLSLQ